MHIDRSEFGSITIDGKTYNHHLTIDLFYVGPTSYYDYYGEYGAPDCYWYYCEDPPGYYPYVQHCNGSWEPVPPAPNGD